jgi:hypothetical protein
MLFSSMFTSVKPQTTNYEYVIVRLLVRRTDNFFMLAAIPNTVEFCALPHRIILVF